MESKNLLALRHTAEHVLHQAMTDLYPGLKRAMGPATEEGFYFDFEFSKKISESDFPKIEKRMQELIDANLPLVRQKVSYQKAKQLFIGNKYKLDWLNQIQKRKEPAIIYWTGKPEEKGSDPDLCSGPHLKSTGEIKAFKLLSVAGAYWHGDEKNKMLTRIYGTAFYSPKELRQYLNNRQLAEKNNHRRLGKQLELFVIFPEIGSGLPVWLPNGYTIRRILENYMLDLEKKSDYQHILTPHISQEKLFEISGHLDFYKESMYPPNIIDDETYYLKPMNCPAGMMVYAMKPRSYKDLPLKLGELGTVYRYEKTGELQGLQRVRGFTQNDAHIFCTKDQLAQEIQSVVNLLKRFYKDLGFNKYKFVLATSDPKKEKYKFCGKRSGWVWAENILRQSLIDNHFPFQEQPGEAAFYGPKIDVLAVNVFGKADAISTIQVDFNLPEKFKLKYIDPKGKPQQPFVVHRALVGSFERFFAFLIEHYGGAFPTWLAPVQVRILPIADKHLTYARKILDNLRQTDIRAEIDDKNDTIQNKIRQAHQDKVSHMLIIGDKEEKTNTVTQRTRSNKINGPFTIDTFIKNITLEIDNKVIN